MNKKESKYFATAAKMDEALIELLEKKDFEYITVKEICERAGVNRSTFYLHYENTVDLLHEATRHVINEFLSYFSEMNKKRDVQKAHSLDIGELIFIDPKYILPYLAYIKENSRVFVTALHRLDVMGFDAYYGRMFKYIFDPIMERFGVERADREYIMKFYLTGITAISTEWIKKGCVESPERICDIIIKCVGGYRASEI